MAKTDLLKEAIADAKAVRETALANAKIALEEAFTPRIQSMLSAKLAEDEEMDEMAEDPIETNGDGMDAAAGSPVDEAEADATVEVEPVTDEEPGMEEDMAEPEMEEDMEEPGMEEDLELEAILRELEGEDTMDEAEDKEETNEVSDSTDIGKGDNKMDQVSSSDQDDPGKGKLKEAEGDDKEDVKETKEDDQVDEDVSLDEIIAALNEDEGEEDVKEENYTAGVDDGAASKDLEEAYNVIKFLKSKINEVNLLNAKLLFSNKLFRNHSLNESQKMKVIENFDRAQSLREVKLVFATLSESFKFTGGKTKRTIKESYASKPTRSTAPKKQVISEGTQLAARWKKLANL
jgi:hypothetical protein